jgi:hypothetical protein
MKKPYGVSGWMCAAGLVVLVAGLIVTGCSIKSPQAPSWDTTLKLPLVDKTYTSAELFEKLATDNIVTDSTGNSYFRVEQNMDSVTVGSVLALSARSSEFEKQVGLIAVPTPPVMSEQIAFADYMPLIAGVVPDTGLNVIKSIGPTNTFSEATIAQGSLIVSATNNTGFALDSLSVELRAAGTGSLLGTVVVPQGLAEGATVVDTLPLAGRTVHSENNLEVYFHTQGGLALSLADRSLDFLLQYTDDLLVSSVTGKVGQFSHDYDQRELLTDEAHLQTAAFASGTLNFSVENHLPVGSELTVTFPDITYGGSALILSLNVGANGTIQQSHNLAGWTIQPQSDSLRAHLTADVMPSGENYVSVNSSDGFTFRYALDNLQLESATGIIDPTAINWDNRQVSVDIPKGFDNVSLETVELELCILNHTELAGDVQIELVASNAKHLSVGGNVAPGSTTSPSTNIITSDQLANFLTPLPKTITISGIATVGDAISTVHVSRADFLSGRAVISAPMALKFEQTDVRGDESHVDVDADIADRADRLQQGIFRSTITNHLPLGAQVTIYIGTDSATIFSHPLTTIGPLAFSSAAVDANGLVTSDAVSSNTITMTADDLHVFRNRSLYIAPLVTLPGTNGQTVRIRASDFFDINGIVEISARVGGEDF